MFEGTQKKKGNADGYSEEFSKWILENFLGGTLPEMISGGNAKETLGDDELPEKFWKKHLENLIKKILQRLTPRSTS